MGGIVPGETMKVAIVGSRDYPRDDLVRAFIRALPQGTIVVSGGARGVDHIAATYARLRGLGVIEHPARWRVNDVYNPRAGFERNTLIVDDCDTLIAFWDGASNGTRDSIAKAVAQSKLLNVLDSYGKIVR